MAIKLPSETRRQFLTRLPRRTALAAAGAFGAREVIAAKRGYLTDLAGNRYQPLYERHEIGPGEELSPEATGVWGEVNYFATAPDGSPVNIYNVPADQLAQFLRRSPGGKILPGSDKLITAVQQRRLPLAVGDVLILEEAAEDQRTEAEKTRDDGEFRASILLLLASQSPELLRRIWERINPGESAKTFDRRTALKLLARGLAAGGAAIAFRQLHETEFVRRLFLSEKIDTPGEKILARLFGIGVHFHPEEPLDFSRNVIMAIKIKLFNQWQRDQDVGRPFTAFNVGTRHSGIEDLLLLPLPLLEELAVLANEKYLRKAGIYFGRDAGAVRVIQADEAGIFGDVARLENKRLASFGRSEHGIPQRLTAPLFPTMERPPKKKK
jgi:hypothetical protein